MTENDAPRYAHLKEALAQTTDGSQPTCDLFLEFLQTGELAARREAGFLARYGLNSTRQIILVLLDNAHSGSLRSSELAAQIAVSRATMTGLLDTLEKAGLVTRAPDPHDRRACNVKITKKGETLLTIVQPEESEWACGILAKLSPNERSQLLVLLKKIQDALEETL